MIVDISQATKEDFGQLQMLFRKMFDVFKEENKVNFPFSNEGIAYLYDRIGAGFAYIAKIDSNIVGFLLGSIENALSFKTYDKYGFIQNMYILEDYQRMGIGKSLIESFIEKCKNLKIHHIQADSDANQSLINFYTGNGFKISGINYVMNINT